jgi:hypothetical protein
MDIPNLSVAQPNLSEGFFPSSFQSNEQIPRPRPKSTTMGLSLPLESIDFGARQR